MELKTRVEEGGSGGVCTPNSSQGNKEAFKKLLKILDGLI